MQMRTGGAPRHSHATNSGAGGYLLTFPDLNPATAIAQIHALAICFHMTFEVTVDMLPLTGLDGDRGATGGIIGEGYYLTCPPVANVTAFRCGDV